MDSSFAGRVFPSLRNRDADAVEMMDGPDCDPAVLARTYANFRYVNPLVSGWRVTYRREIRPFLSTTRPSSLLDVGSGGGDVSRSLARWAASDGLRLTVTGIDPDERAHDFAVSQPPVPGLEFRRAFSSELVSEGARFDFVVSNHILHHLSAEELGGLLFDSEQLGRDGGRVLHADIERSRFAYAGFGLATWPFFRDSLIRADGLTSIRRSYTAAELESAVPPGWWVAREAPSRLVLRFTSLPLLPPLLPPPLPSSPARSAASASSSTPSSTARPAAPVPAASMLAATSSPPSTPSSTVPVELDRSARATRPEQANSAKNGPFGPGAAGPDAEVEVAADADVEADADGSAAHGADSDSAGTTDA